MKQQVKLGMALFLMLMSIYLLTYRGLPMSGDEIFIYDSATSFSQRGDFYRVYEYNTIINPLNQLRPTADGTPWLQPVQEPLMALLVAPLIRLARAIDGVGTMHVVWLFNSIVTALTSVSLYTIALSWGYSPNTGWLLGFSYGIATNAWFYSRLLFREPITALLLLWAFAAAMAIQKAWGENSIRWRAVLVLCLCLGLAFLAKVASLLFLPALVIALLPPLPTIWRRWRLFFLATLLVLLMCAGFVFITSNSGFGQRYALSTWIQRLDSIQWNYVLESIVGYQFSLGRSLWLYSPILFAGLFGARRWLGQGEWRIVVGPVLTLLLLSAWYGIALTVDWLGGWGWGPRYLLPLIPILMLWVLPVIPQLTTRLRRIGFGGLIGLGAGMQFLGLAVPLSNYYTDLFLNNKIYDFTLIYSDRAAVDSQWGWLDAIWGWEWSPMRYHLTHLNFSRLDMAWYAASPGWIAPGLALGSIGLVSIWVYFISRKDDTCVVLTNSFLAVIIGLAVILSIAAFVTGLLSLRHDPRVIGEYADVNQLIQQMNTRVDAADAVFIDRHLYTPLFMNTFKPSALVATLPYAPGESYSAQPPQVVSEDVGEQAGREAVYALAWSAQQVEHLWLVTSSSPFEADKRRPIERYLVEHYFPIEEISTSPRARAIRFLTTSAPQGPPEFEAGALFGGELTLVGFDLPAGTLFMPGAVVPVTFVWQPEMLMNVDYNVSVFLENNVGDLVTQRDGPPQATFGYTSRWQPGTLYRDNHGLQLPPGLPEGDYHLQLAVYNWQDGQRLPIISTEGAVDDVYTLGLVTIR